MQLLTAALLASIPTAAAQVVDEYTGLKANNTLARWLPALRRLRGKGDRFEGLDGFDAAVRLLASDKGE